MCIKTLKHLLKSPLDAIKKAKKERDLPKTAWVLITTWLLIGSSFLVLSLKSFPILLSLGVGVAIFLVGIVFSIFSAYIVVVIMNVLGGKGKYFEGFTVISYSSFPVSTGILLTSLFTFIHPIIGFAGFIFIAIGAALSISIYFRSILILFKTDRITAFVGFLILIYVFMASFYLTTVFTSAITNPMINNLISGSLI